jgi:hypothetical protein
MKYLIVQNGNLSLDGGVEGWEVIASSKTIADAKQFIRDEALRYFEPDSINEDFSEHCMHYAIYELKAAIRPTPSIKVNLTLKNIIKELERE